MYKLKKIFKNEKGQGMVEYGLILALVSIVAILGLNTLGGNIKGQFEGITDSMGGISEPGQGPGYSDEEIDDLIKQHDFILVATADELNNVRSDETNLFGKGTKWKKEYIGGLDKKYVQVANINLSVYSEEGWDPINARSSKFTGSYDGGNYTITDLEIKGANKDNQGLFGYTQGATISNVGLINNKVKVTGANNNVGGLVGYAYSGTNISNSYATGSVKGSSEVGGLVGFASNSTKISKSYATGSVTCEGDVGGLVGTAASNSTIENSYATGSVKGTSQVGGLVGWANESTIRNSYAEGSVEGGSDVGGLVGKADGGTINNSYATGSITGTGDEVGGLVGWANESTIRNSYATGSFEGSSRVGGLVGMADGNSTIENSYATGPVKGTSQVGGLVGNAWDSTVTNSYWNTETTGQSSSAGGEGKTTEEMMKQTTYSDWDFVNVWKIDEGSYPTLR